MDAQADFKRGSVRAGRLEFHYLEAGSGPLALCLHGFPDSPWTYRYLLLQLPQARYRAVAPYMRGYAPAQIPIDADYSTEALAADPNALHDPLGGDCGAVLIGNDWDALATGPTRWSRAVVASIPPFSWIKRTYEQLKRAFYIYFFQMAVADGVVSVNNMSFLDGLWGDWSPGYDAAYDLAKAKECLSRPENLKAALGYYRDSAPSRFGSPSWAEQQAATWGRPIPQPVLYLHGANDGCTGLDVVAMDTLPEHLGPGSRAEPFPDAGHFLWVEKPAEANKRAVRFLKAA
jgi:pimeloyl-ACP methyl ester carboxylesterase